MNRHRIPALLIVAFALSAVSGCVDPGPIAATDLSRYQEELLRQSHQERARQGLEMLDPLQSPSGPALQVQQDPKTKARFVRLSLRDAVWCALANSLDIRVVSYEPEISRLDLIRAAAVFDAVAFAEISYTNNDERFNSVFTRTTQSSSRGARVGLRQHTSTGADVSMSYALSREKTDSTSVRDARVYEASATLEIVQPLLRDAWPRVNLASVRVARINRLLSEEAFRQNVERTVTEVETTYWALVQANREVAIQEGLLAKTIETRDLVKARGALDATNVQIAQTEAAVETRRATLIHARKIVLDVQDSLAHLLADETTGLLSGVAIIPQTKARADRVSLDVEDQLTTAMEHNPQLVQARLAIAAAGEEVVVADNSLLPRLDLAASATYRGLADAERKVHDQVIDAKHDNYAVGLSLEYPLGNRAAGARARRARVERLKAITAHRNAASVVARTVKERIRQIETTYQELSAQNARVKAATLQLSAIEATGELRQRSPEFLQLQISAQEALAAALRSQSQSVIDYKAAQITLAQATGTVLKLYGVEMRQVSQPGSNR